MRILYPCFFLIAGVVCVFMFHANAYLPIWISVLFLTAVTFFLISEFKARRAGVLVLLLWTILGLPFIHVIPYLWFDFRNGDSPDFWKMYINPYTLDQNVIQLTSMIGAVMAIGFALGISMHRKALSMPDRLHVIRINDRRRSLILPIFLLWLLAGLSLSWLSAPEQTLFAAAYSTSGALLEDANFSSAWMLSYAIFSFAFCDAMFDQDIARRRLKIKLILATLAYVVLVLQLLRGDRESFPFVFGLCMIYYYWATPFTLTQKLQVPWRRIVLVALAILVVSMIIGGIRAGLTDINDLKALFEALVLLYDADVIGFGTLFHGTWSAAFLTPMSVAGDHVYNLLDLKLGQTYLDLFLSIPPGFITDAVGYTRPITGLAGPAWEMRYGIGGTHATVVPFMNFSMTGVLLVTALWAYAFSSVERRTMREGKASSQSLLCIVVMAAPHWLWYGEKSIINALIMWLLLRFFYSCSLFIGRMSRPISTDISLSGSRLYNAAS